MIDFLIGDGGIITNPYKSKSIEAWTLSDFIEDMRTWTDQALPRELGYEDLWKILQKQYQGLATWLEYYLLENSDSQKSVYSDVYLCYLKPHADLSVASYDFIKRHFYPRYGDIWDDIAPTHNHLWAFSEYSLLSRKIQEKLEVENKASKNQKIPEKLEVENKAPKNKTDYLKRLGSAIYLKEERLNNIEGKQNSLISKLRSSESVNSISIYLTREIQDSFECFRRKSVNNIFRLIILQSEIFSVNDSNFRSHFSNYLHQWSIYRNAVKNSPHFQLCSLMPDNTLMTSKKGRPKIQKPKRDRGRPKKGDSGL
jgi:hypothetical protein